MTDQPMTSVPTAELQALLDASEDAARWSRPQSIERFWNAHAAVAVHLETKET